MSRKVFFISGLGANENAFQFLNLSFCQPVFIEWIKPLPKETLQEYAIRLRGKITETDPIIVGVSFGGMLAVEMAKENSNIKAIIISSSKISKEIPSYLKAWRHLPIYKWISPKLVKLTGGLTRTVVGPEGKEQRKVFTQILNDSDYTFTSWAIDAILHWKNNTVPANVIHIHGSADKLLPYKYVTAHHTIHRGKHLMIMDHAEELSKLLKELIGEGE